ncbi:MAG: hypothetical protein K9J85_05085 [Desulfobacteraceae bacterium]|nr:hypothetical protein [Desulfobacteraceae bacterium]
MASILILDNQQNRRQRLARYLSEAGHTICSICDSDVFSLRDLSGFDLAIVNFYPDAPRTWDFYRRIKNKYKHLPVVVYLENNFDALRSLKQVIASITGEKPAAGQCIPCRRQAQNDAPGSIAGINF